MGGAVEVRYGYRYSGPHELREQVLRVPSKDMEDDFRECLMGLYRAVERRIPTPNVVRLPHAAVTPAVESGLLTFVVLDQARASTLPFARLYYYETVAPLDSRIEREIRVERDNWTAEEIHCCFDVAHRVRKLAWRDYERLMGYHLFGNDNADA